MTERFSFFLVKATPEGDRAVQALLQPHRALTRTFDVESFDGFGPEFWSAAPNRKPVGCLIELAESESERPQETALKVEEAAERLDAHGVSVFLFTSRHAVPVEWMHSPFVANYHFLDLSRLTPEALLQCEETVIGHLHFARFVREQAVQVYVPSAIKFLHSRPRLEMECFVMREAEKSSARGRCFAKLLAHHACPDFNAVEFERFDCTIDDLLEARGVSFSTELPLYLLERVLEALQFLHDWTDAGLKTFGDFRRRVQMPLRQIIPESTYFRHFRHLSAEEQDALPFQIIHCDLKPGNVLVRLSDSAKEKLSSGQGVLAPKEIPEVKLFDFDLARYGQPEAGSTGSASGPQYTGTLGYTAPELFLTRDSEGGTDAASERKITPFVDFYAVGTLLFELLMRQPLIPREMLDVPESAYYRGLKKLHKGRDFTQRLRLVRDSNLRKLVHACTQFRQADRERELQALIESSGCQGMPSARTISAVLNKMAAESASERPRSVIRENQHP